MNDLIKVWGEIEPGIVGLLFGLEISVCISFFYEMMKGIPLLANYIVMWIGFGMSVLLMCFQYPIMKEQILLQLSNQKTI